MLSRLLSHPVRFILGTVLALFVLYEIGVQIFAYTGDAYVDSDIVVLASQIEGPIARLAVQNNAEVKAGDLLFEVEATPFRLRVQQTEAALSQARSNLALATDEVAAARATLQAAQAVQTNATEEMNRTRTLSGEGFSSQASLDEASKDLAKASADVMVTQAGLNVASRRVAVAEADVVSAQAALDRAQYDLTKTQVRAPDAGRVAPFTLRQGDYLQVGTKVLAIVTEKRLRVVANVAERHLGHVALGQRAFVTLGTDPWVLHRGRVTGIAAGIARSPDAPDIVPYVAPTTDWVRLPRRFPVEITLDDWPAGRAHYTGADARVLIWFRAP
ncbi:HlyD family secretion protein [Ancylobacter lacus]|uniref:HlyD family secretion protein n=1 Tax=Ancylobacter lacus TaxID=2579970 RepID=UPI001BCA7054|nr:HlyD family secretion protein [Ancylobacter lacus]MBS7539195.1 HlyD family secretion protein [Ancylobacter lacus]